MPDPVYMVVSDPTGKVVAQRYIDHDRVGDWLARNSSGGGCRCDLYDDAPALGGKLRYSLHRRKEDALDWY